MPPSLLFFFFFFFFFAVAMSDEFRAQRRELSRLPALILGCPFRFLFFVAHSRDPSAAGRAAWADSDRGLPGDSLRSWVATGL